MPSKLTILLDLDEVLTDFTNPAAACHDVGQQELELEWSLGVWGLQHVISKAIGKELTVEEFWKPINERGYEFWSSMKLLPWFYELLALASSQTDNWYIVSSHSSGHENEFVGKRAFIRDWLLEKHHHRFIPTQHKHLMANASTILLDDKPENIRKFAEYGGQTILFPYIGNDNYQFRHNPLLFVEPELIQLCNNIKSFD